MGNGPKLRTMIRQRKRKKRDREGRQRDEAITGAFITQGSVCRKEKRKFPVEDNGFGQAHNSFIRGFTLSGHGR